MKKIEKIDGKKIAFLLEMLGFESLIPRVREAQKEIATEYLNKLSQTKK